MATIETDLKEIFTKLDQRFDRLEQRLERMEGDLNYLKVSQVEIKGDIKALDEKLSGQIKTLDERVNGIGKRLENQEFTNRGILTAVIIALIGGAAKFFGIFPNP
jgi:predicted  nucleic acid-binding Zn-ribbon protein